MSNGQLRRGLVRVAFLCVSGAALSACGGEVFIPQPQSDTADCSPDAPQGDCPPGQTCVAGACQDTLSVGQLCTTDSACASGSCVIGVCRGGHCNNAIRDGDEVGIDCGGASCGACPGDPCVDATTCESGSCDASNTCSGSTCSDGIENGAETGVDCGGDTCPGCDVRGTCLTSTDCTSGVCGAAGNCPGPDACTCQAPSCSDGVANGNEAGVDCGGTCALSTNGSKTCGNGTSCTSDSDCTSNVCNGTCQAPASHCTNGVTDGGESGVDCGGSECAACADGGDCSVSADCTSGICGAGNSCPGPATCTCQSAGCSDGVRNGSETGVDCGGTCALAANGGKTCADGGLCGANSDCTSGVCNTGTCQAPASHCTNGATDGGETGVDCGGPDCAACADGSPCTVSADCTNGICGIGNSCPGPAACTCETPGCTDGVKNGDETGVDCGGACDLSGKTCEIGAACGSDADCTSGNCSGTCQPAPSHCTNAVHDGDETGVDCGGPTCAACAAGGQCSASADCTSGICGLGNSCPGPALCTCQTLGCSDGVQNQGELGVDCGGPCLSGGKTCPAGTPCGSPADCTSGVCDGTGHCAAPVTAVCGDGSVTSPEACDTSGTPSFADDVFTSQTCKTQGFGGGTLGCAAGCGAIDTSQCTPCGNGRLDSGEQCDDGNTEDHDNCRNDCTRPVCGDGFASTAATGAFFEGCDDANADDLDNCRTDCRVPFCGDGVISTDATGALHEVCDDGINDGSYGNCMPDCTRAPYCGDGIVTSLNEECDDGVNDGAYGTCRSTCRLAPHCGDGVVTTPPESCDDSNTTGGDGCSANCTTIESGSFCPTPGSSCLAACGNGRFDSGEQCDDGGRCADDTACTIGGAACADSSTCAPRGGDGCSATCTTEAKFTCPRFGQPCTAQCGNGVLDSGEVCDDVGMCDDNATRCRVTTAASDCAGTSLHQCTTRSGDGCNATCTGVEAGWECPLVGQPCDPICGNGRRDVGEQCDNGAANSDTQYGGCKLNCTLGPRCGDSVVQTSGGEQCDNGVAGNTGAYGGCRQDCTWSVHCGDGAITAGETCENGGVCNNGVDCSHPATGTPDQLCEAIPPSDPSWKCSGVGGDGCGATCIPEAGYICRTPGQPCMLASLCGNGVIDGDERCDDGGLCNDNWTRCTSDAFCQLQDPAWTCTARAGDGCDANCSTVETGYLCPAPGQRCTATKCGDGIRSGFEQCDDGNSLNGDGCSSACRQEPSATSCGNGILEGSEQCDDHNTTSGDGCSSGCALETNFECFNTPNVLCGPASGQGSCPCTAKTAVCGDGILEGVEQCDDGKQCGDVAHTTCTADAQCESLLNTCASRCGNFVCELGECSSCPGDCSAQCNTTALPSCGDGTCGSGEAADTCPSDCGSKHCGDENFTACTDDTTCTAIAQANYPCTERAGDGCGPTCKVEALFECFLSGTGNFCRPICGDGKTLIAVGEKCDDGNLTSGDGCSSSCTIESGSTCTDMSGLPATLDIGMTFRDFRGLGDDNGSATGECTDTSGLDGYPTDTATAVPTLPNLSGKRPASWQPRYCGHYDFEHYSCPDITTGLVKSTLSASGKPQMNWSCNGGTSANSCDTDADCTAIGDSTPCSPARSGTGGCGFDGFGSVQELTDPTRFSQWYVDTTNVNRSFVRTITLALQSAALREYQFSSNAFFPLTGVSGNYGDTPGFSDDYGFTSEWHTFFQYNGGETLQFTGDDDVWVFINGQLAVDLGGLHPEKTGSVTLSNTIDSTLRIKTDARFGIYEKGIYEIAFFHAERHTDASNFQLTLSGFLRADESTCTGICGNGIAQKGEVCDDGAANGTPGDPCSSTCTATGTKPTAACGNHFLDSGEDCDDGNTDNTDTCTNSCKLATCGDGFTQAALGEVCDDGAQNGTYGHCVLGCTAMGPHCGDAIVNGSETCDDGINNGAYGTCTSTCTKGSFCGDGAVQSSFEECDAGTGNNDGQPPDRCNSNCTLNAVCGDSVTDVSRGEQCDNGVDNNNTTCNGCTTSCTFGPRCGDGVVNCGEVCDDGTNTGGYGGCMPGCGQLASRCGDGVKDAGEACDLGSGANTGAYGGCNPDCTLAARCGDAFLDGGFEQCDLGTASNTGAYGTCNSNCTLPAYCGDAVVENPPEVCDDGVNNGAYNTCNSDCSFPARCGDAIVQNPPEQCDDGVNNVLYGPGCRPNCTTPPSCGDGVIQSQHESCDSNLLGGRTCTDLNGNGVTGEPGDFAGGTLACNNATCGLDTSECFRCGDNVKNGSEECDGVGVCGQGSPTVDCGGLTCESLGFTTTTGLSCLDTCTLDTSGCSGGNCGNGVVDAGEQCDASAANPTGTRACNDLDGDGTTGEPGDFAGGVLGCSNGCTLDTSGCFRCGDGVKNGTELCDGSDVGGATCTSVSGNFTGGTLTCNATCDGYDTSGCFSCSSCSDCGGQACVSHQCGSCLDSSECCAPLLCIAGTCTLF